jgi:hypothetical protein
VAQTFQYWRTDGSLNPAPPGIKILSADTNYNDVEYSHGGGIQRGYPATFAAYTGENLRYLYATDVGRKVINYLQNNDRIAIGFAMLGNNARALAPEGSMNRVGWELYSDKKPGPQTRAAFFRRFNKPPSNAVDGLCTSFAGMLNRQPLWDITKRPGDSGGAWSVLQSAFDALVRFTQTRPTVSVSIGAQLAPEESSGGPSLFQPAMSGLDVTGPEVKAWMMHGTAPARLSDTLKQQLRLATVVALAPLEQWGTPGGGSKSTIGFAIDPQSEMNQQRPPAIGLAHELVHAYLSAKGHQPGHEGPTDPSTVLFEFRCVGIGPWEGTAVCENAFRDQWSQAVSAYGTTMDAPNKRIPGKRVLY